MEECSLLLIIVSDILDSVNDNCTSYRDMYRGKYPNTDTLGISETINPINKCSMNNNNINSLKKYFLFFNYS